MALGYLADKTLVRLHEIGGLLLHARGEVVAHLLKLLFLVPSLRGIAAHPDDADHGPGAVKDRALYGVEIPFSVDGRHYLLMESLKKTTSCIASLRNCRCMMSSQSLFSLCLRSVMSLATPTTPMTVPSESLKGMFFYSQTSPVSLNVIFLF